MEVLLSFSRTKPDGLQGVEKSHQAKKKKYVHIFSPFLSCSQCLCFTTMACALGIRSKCFFRGIIQLAELIELFRISKALFSKVESNFLGVSQKVVGE
jgi:hypothetical protein